MAFDVEAVRAAFPSLSAGIAHFDGPGGSQTPEPVARAIHDIMVAPISNRGAVTASEQLADSVVRQARTAMADLLGAPAEGVVFGRSMTQLTFDFARTLATEWTVGDEVVVSRLDHDANVRPWVIAAERAGASVRWIDFDPDTTELTVEHVTAQLSDRTRLVAFTGASNLLGTCPDVSAIAAAVRASGALCYLDAVHLAAHRSINLDRLGVDFVACSPYKFFGPHCGVLAADPALLARLRPDKLVPSSDAVPERFELGTLPYELLAGTTAAIDFIASFSEETGSRSQRLAAALAASSAHEDRLRDRIETGLKALAGLTVHSRALERTPTLLLTFADRPVADAYRFLAERRINAPAGTFYAYETAQHLGLPGGGLRIGLAPYSCDEDVDRLLDALDHFIR